MWPNVRKDWFGKNLLYGFGTLLLRPLRTLHGVGNLFGAARSLCNITNVASSLQIELVSIVISKIFFFFYFNYLSPLCVLLDLIPLIFFFPICQQHIPTQCAGIDVLTIYAQEFHIRIVPLFFFFLLTAHFIFKG